MYKEKNEKSFIIEILLSFTTIFTVSLFTFLIIGFMVIRFFPLAQELSSIFVLKGTGLSNSTILQIAGLSIFLAVFKELLLSYRFLEKMRFLLRYFLFFLASLFSISVFSIIFNWFPKYNLFAWINFLVWLILCFIITSVISFLKFKLADKKYNILLDGYKKYSIKNKDNVK